MQSRGADYGEDEYVSVIPSSDIEAQVRVTCPDKTGLGSDITRTIFDFGFVVLKGDFATDGKWAFVLVTVRRRGGGAGQAAGELGPAAHPPREPLPEQGVHLDAVVPEPALRGRGSRSPRATKGAMYILQVEVEDGWAYSTSRRGSGRRADGAPRTHLSLPDTAVDLFYVTDERNELPAEADGGDFSKRAACRATNVGNRWPRWLWAVGTAASPSPAPKFVTKTSSAGRLVSQLHREDRTPSAGSTRKPPSPWTISCRRSTRCFRCALGTARACSTTCCARPRI